MKAKGWQRNRERERIARSFLPRCIVYERERGGGVSVGVMIECLDYQLDFRGVYVDDVRSAVAAWNRRTKEEKIRLGVMKGPRGRGGGELVTIEGEIEARAGRSEEARNERRFSRRRSVLIRVTALNSKLP